MGVINPQGFEIVEPFAKDLEDVSVFLNDVQEIRSGIFNCGQIFAQLTVSRVVVVRDKTFRRSDVTVSVVGEFLILQPRWWGGI